MFDNYKHMILTFILLISMLHVVMLHLLGNAEKIRVVSLGTGTKCIGKSKLSADGKICKLYCYISLFHINEYT